MLKPHTTGIKNLVSIFVFYFWVIYFSFSPPPPPPGEEQSLFFFPVISHNTGPSAKNKKLTAPE
jgi:hypothetical protein